MTTRTLARGAAGFGALLLAGTAMPASAATLLFDFTGTDGRSFNFTLDDTQAPDGGVSFGSAVRIEYNNVLGTFVGANGTDTRANISFGTGFLSTLQVGSINFAGVFRGPALFNGSRTDPQFNLGQFTLTPGALTSAGGTLSVSQVAAVPEPATWAMMLLGFLAVGGVLRARRVEVGRRNISYS